MRILLSSLALVFAASAAEAVPVTVLDSEGQPVQHAVVTLQGPGGAPTDYGQPAKVSQKDMKFVPYVLAVPVGTDVEFPNLDRVRHHVYSFSKGNRFQLELYGREEQRAISFDTPGTVAIGCNIHDEMIAFIRVSDAPSGAVTDMQGTAVLASVPAGATEADVWLPALASQEPLRIPLVADGDGFTLTLPEGVTSASSPMVH